MTVATLDNFFSAKEIAPSWRFIASLPRIPRAPNLEYPIYVVGGEFTHPFIDTEGRFHSGSFVYYPQQNNINAISMNFIETEDYDILEYMYRWRNLVVSEEDGTYGASKDYKKLVELTMLNNMGKEALKIVYKGIWPTETGNLSVSGSEENFVTIEQTFSTDSCVFRRLKNDRSL